MSHHHHHKNKEKEKVCIKTRKVYDWVTRQIDLPLMSFSNSALNEIFTSSKKDKDQHKDHHLPCNLSPNADYTVECSINEESLVCREVMQQGGRPDVTITLPNGEEVTLQRVKVLIKGTLTVQLLNDMGQVVCTSKPIPFAVTQNFLLCAPEGTELDCEVFADCEATLITSNDLTLLEISVMLCVDIQMEADVKLEIEAKFCTPREEIAEPIALCPTNEFPPQCPEVFPTH